MAQLIEKTVSCVLYLYDYTGIYDEQNDNVSLPLINFNSKGPKILGERLRKAKRGKE